MTTLLPVSGILGDPGVVGGAPAGALDGGLWSATESALSGREVGRGGDAGERLCPCSDECWSCTFEEDGKLGGSAGTLRGTKGGDGDCATGCKSGAGQNITPVVAGVQVPPLCTHAETAIICGASSPLDANLWSRI